MCLLSWGFLEPASSLPKEVTINGVEFVHVPEGWFWHVVSTGDRNKTPPGKTWFREVKVWLDGYYIAKYEARARDFKRFMETGKVQHVKDYAVGTYQGCSVRRLGEEGEWFLTNPDVDLPATHLSWNLAKEFTEWMGFRMPKETEWIKAARGTDHRVFPWGDEYPDDTFAGFGVASGCNSTPVDAFPNGRSPYGAYNMAGNVLELVEDWENFDYDKELKDGVRNPLPPTTGSMRQGQDGPKKIAKGGRWGDAPSSLHVYIRRILEAEQFFICYGTRFAIDEAAVKAHLQAGTAQVILP